MLPGNTSTTPPSLRPLTRDPSATISPVVIATSPRNEIGSGETRAGPSATPATNPRARITRALTGSAARNGR
jgi:hypothetical protein